MVSKAASLAVLAACAAAAFPLPAAASTSDALNAIAAYDPARLQTLAALDAAMRAPGKISVPGLRQQLASGTFDRRWAATYVAHAVAADPGDLRALRPSVRDANASIRALAAFGLAGRGEKAALGVLVALVASRQLMVQGDGEPIAALVQERLTLLTGAQVRGGRTWRRWWREVRRNIHWDRGAERYRWRRVHAGRAVRATIERPVAAPIASAAADAVTIPIKVQILWGPGVTSAQKSAILRNIHKAVDALNGKGRTGRCKPIEFSLDLVVGGALLDDHYSIVVNDIPERNKARWSTSWIDTDRTTGRFWTERAADPEGYKTIAHEFGHVSGLPDEYYEYVDAQGRTTTAPVDPASFMGDSRNGSLLQRHLDYLSRLHDPAGDAGCERWALRFGAWTSQLDAWTEEAGGGATNWLGLTAVARIAAFFWAGADGAIHPAGYTLCGGEVTPGRTPANPGGRTSRCPEAGGNSEGLSAHANEGAADCAPPGAGFSFVAPRFDATVRGSRQGDSFALKLAVGDSEQAEASRCDPAVEPAITKRYTLIRDGLRFAGALAFTMSPPSRDFRRDEEHKHAFGQASLSRVE